MNIILFDANSTSVVSGLIAVAPGECILINSWGLEAGETAQVYRAFVALGTIPEQSGSCEPPKSLRAAEQQAESPYLPCNVAVSVGQGVDQTITSLVLQQPGFYRVHLTPSALGTAIVEAVVLKGAEACQMAGSQCCCLPATEVDFDVCAAIGAFPAGALVVGDVVPVIEAGGACKLVPATAFGGGGVVFPLLGPDGSCLAPTYSFTTSPDSGMWYDASGVGQVVISDDNCVDQIRVGGGVTLQTTSDNITLAAGGTGDIIGTGTTVSFTAGDDLNLTGTVSATFQAIGPVAVHSGSSSVALQTAGTNRLIVNNNGSFDVGGSGVGTAGQVITSNGAGGPPTWQSVSATPSFPLLAPDGSCLAPSYSFTSSPDSGMFYDPAGAGSVVISDDNCADTITLGAGIAAISNSFRIATSLVSRLFIDTTGAWQLGALPGTAGQVLTSNGAGTAPTWQAVPAGTPSFPLLAPDGSCSAPSYSFTSSPDSGMFYDPSGVGSVRIGDDNCVDAITIGASVTIRTNSVDRLTFEPDGSWNIGGSNGTAGQAIVSNGASAAPTWQTVTASVPLNLVADATGSATRSHGTNQVEWQWNGLGSASAAALHLSGLSAGSQNGDLFRLTSTQTGNTRAIRILQQSGVGGAITQELFRTGGQNATVLEGANSFPGTSGNSQSLILKGGDAYTTSLSGGGSASLIGGLRGGAIFVTGGDGSTAGSLSAGGPVTVRGGSGGGANNPGGQIELVTGTGAGGGPLGINGRIQFGIGPNDVGRIDHLNSWVLAHPITPLVVGATAGYTHLPKVAGPPSGTPAQAYPGAVPFLAEVAGSTVVLWAHDGTAWRSITLV